MGGGVSPETSTGVGHGTLHGRAHGGRAPRPARIEVIISSSFLQRKKEKHPHEMTPSHHVCEVTAPPSFAAHHGTPQCSFTCHAEESRRACSCTPPPLRLLLRAPSRDPFRLAKGLSFPGDICCGGPNSQSQGGKSSASGSSPQTSSGSPVSPFGGFQCGTNPCPPKDTPPICILNCTHQKIC